MSTTRVCLPSALLLTATAFSPPCLAAEPAGDTLVFIGERLSIEDAPSPCEQRQAEGEAPDCISLDTFYTARYRVLDRIVGQPPTDPLTFRVAEHYGFPAFARYRHALLFMALSDDGPWLHKYQAIPVHRTVEGQWASCGDLRRNPADPPSPQVRALRFEREIARESDLPEGLLADYRAGQRPELRVERGKVWCTQGILLQDAYEIVRNGALQARGVALPAWPGISNGESAQHESGH